jgi:peptidoglycan hydrolase-like protein with peptidoglycan-binding domain
VQTILSQRSYNPGPIDGMLGPKTARAIARYQRDNGLEADGLATLSLIRHMQHQPETAPEVVAVEAAVPSRRYQEGTRFVYSGIEVHTVTDTDGGLVSWETSLGDHYVTGPNFGLPEIDWQSGTWKGRSKSTFSAETAWPPVQGVEIRFDVNSEEWNEADGKNAQRYTSDSSWVCRNDGSKQVKVPSGSFDAQTILCERSPAPAGAWQKRLWYYVPAIGHFVRRDDFDGAGLEVAKLELIAILPGIRSSSLQKGLEGAIHDALDRAEPGETAIWHNPVGAGNYAIKVYGRFDGPGGRLCRTYTVARQDGVNGLESPAVACQGSGTPRWVIPGLD